MGEYTNALVSALQGASNAAASNISGPVDLIAWALRKAGVPVPSNPVMGSDWMRQKGLLAEPQSKMAGLLGEGLGMAAPAVAAAKAPQIARGLLNVADDFQAYNKALGPAGVSQATVWHGSPHKFDRFDSSKIGTGEGAQAYGHGLYLADAPGVAGSYQGKLSGSLPSEISAGGKIYGFKEAAEQAFGKQAADALVASGAPMRQEAWAGIADTLRSKGMKDAKPVAGNLYKVDLPDPLISRMLDWDKPLSQQAPEVQAAISRGWNPDEAMVTKSGGALWQELNRPGLRSTPTNGGARDAAEWLRAQGIPGIRYLDGGSRGAGAGTSNYVVFPGEESALTILERNGSPINAIVQALRGPR